MFGLFKDIERALTPAARRGTPPKKTRFNQSQKRKAYKLRIEKRRKKNKQAKKTRQQQRKKK